MRQELIAAGVLVPGEWELRHARSPIGLALDDTGRAAAVRHVRDGERGAREMPLAFDQLAELARRTKPKGRRR